MEVEVTLQIKIISTIYALIGIVCQKGNIILLDCLAMNCCNIKVLQICPCINNPEIDFDVGVLVTHTVSGHSISTFLFYYIK